ncbi:hypothetical protein J3F83DRAFT_743384 [Trichoderma novae-zelandiae]
MPFNLFFVFFVLVCLVILCLCLSSNKAVSLFQSCQLNSWLQSVAKTALRQSWLGQLTYNWRMLQLSQYLAFNPHALQIEQRENALLLYILLQNHL